LVLEAITGAEEAATTLPAIRQPVDLTQHIERSVFTGGGMVVYVVVSPGAGATVLGLH
jgi:hypothetical protein